MPPAPSKTLCSMLGITSGQSFDVEPFERLYVHISTLAAKSPEEDLLSRARVGAVELKKERDGPQHEYLLIYITLDGQRKGAATLGVIKCERTVAHDLRNRRPRFTSFAVSALSSGSSSSSLQRSPALDHFTIYNSRELPAKLARDQLVYEYDFPRMRAPPPTGLFAAASTLHNRFPHYILLQRQCYWFAGMVFRMLVGTEADELCATRNSEDVELAIAYRTESESGPATSGLSCTAMDTTAPKASAGHKTVAVSGGTFKTIFRLVTKDDIEQCYADLEKAYKARVKRVDDELAQVRENAQKRLVEVEEKDQQIAALAKELEALKARLPTDPDQHLTIAIQMPTGGMESWTPMPGSASTRSSTVPNYASRTAALREWRARLPATPRPRYTK